MLDEILVDYPQIKVIDYLLMNPFAELSKLQIAVGAEISRITLNKFIDDLTDKELVIKNTNSKYHLNLQSPIVVKLNRLLDELNKLAIEEAINHADESYDMVSDDEFDEIFDENSPDVDLIQLENEILMKEGYGIFIEEINENYVLLVWFGGFHMEKGNIPINKNMVIVPDSEMIYASSVGVGADNEEVRLILFNKRLISDGENIEIINESDTQIILNKATASKLKELLDEHLKDWRYFRWLLWNQIK